MDYNKYIDLAYSNSAGLALRAKVEERWQEWEDLVAQAPWIINWRWWFWAGHNSAELARKIFFSGVWGFGWEKWHLLAEGLRGTPAQLTFKNPMSQAAQKAIAEIHGKTRMGASPCYTWDKQMAAEGLYVPCEYAELDRWLESLQCL